MEDVLGISDKRHMHIVGEVGNAAEVLAATGQDAKGYTRVIDNYGLRHAIRKHGDSLTETPRGQVAITVDDLKNADQVVKRPDGVEDGGKSKTKLHVLVSRKELGGHTLFVSEEIRPGRKQMVLASMWKRKTAAT